MIKFFDYLFIRTYIQYKKWREDYPYPFAEGLLIVIQGFLILDIITIITMFNLLPRKIENPKLYALIGIFILYFFNHTRYSKKHIELLNAYNEVIDINKKRNGILIILFICFLIAFSLIVGALRNNFGYDI